MRPLSSEEGQYKPPRKAVFINTIKSSWIGLRIDKIIEAFWNPCFMARPLRTCWCTPSCLLRYRFKPIRANKHVTNHSSAEMFRRKFGNMVGVLDSIQRKINILTVSVWRISRYSNRRCSVGFVRLANFTRCRLGLVVTDRFSDTVIFISP